MIDKKWINDHNWLYFQYVPSCPVWLVWSPILAYNEELEKIVGVGVKNACYIYIDGNLHMYLDGDDYARGGKVLLENTKKDKNALSSILDNIEKYSNDLFDYCKRLQDKNMKKATDKELLDYYQGFISIHNPLWWYGQAVNYLEHQTSLLYKTLKNSLLECGISEKEVNNVIAILIKPEGYSLAQKEEYDLYQLAKSKDADSLRNHYNKYASIMFGWEGPALEFSFFEERFKSFQKSKDNSILFEKQYVVRVQDEKRKIIHDYSIPKNPIIFANLLERVGFLKGLRIDASHFGYWVIESLFKEVGKRRNLSLKQVRYIFPSEMEDVIMNNRADVDVLNNRWKRSVLIFKNNVFREVFGKDAEGYLSELEKMTEKKLSGLRHVHGETGSPGKASGIVRIINHPDEMKKMKEGDILVAHATDPRLVPAMKKAAAIVAEVGGVTCHAAIVSRELNIPCVIGAKIATRVLKDGDFVTVNATHGEVKKLEN